MTVLPYSKGISEKLCRLYKRHNINVAFKPANTLRNLSVHSNDKIHEESCGVLYKVDCDNCEGQYIDESRHALKTRIDEHKRSVIDHTYSSAISEHVINADHKVNWDSVKIIERESNDYSRKPSGAIHIR